MFIYISGTGQMAETIASACRGTRIKYSESHASWTKHEDGVVIHAGSKERLKKTLIFCEENMVPLIHASTGQDDLIPAKPRYPIIVAPNCAAPIVALIEQIIPTMNVLQALGMTVKLKELHQASKVDKPSGTALAIAKKLDILPSSIHAERIGVSPRARHKLIFDSPGLQIELLLKARGRRIYAVGALSIAKAVIEKSPLTKGIYTVQQILGI